jgi:acyl-CoA-binding protein
MQPPGETDEDLGLIPGEDAFSAAADRVAAAVVAGGARPSEAELLRLYGLYKQATLGDCGTPRPWFWQLAKLQQWCGVTGGARLSNASQRVPPEGTQGTGLLGSWRPPI